MTAQELSSVQDNRLFIAVTGVRTSMEQDVVRMTQLFMPLAEVRFESPLDLPIDMREKPGEELLLAVDLIGEGDLLTAAVSLSGLSPETKLEKVVRRSRSQLKMSVDDATARRKGLKRALMFALHECLSEWTGEAQLWGMLTGVRPGKLAHAAYRSGLQESAALRAHLQSEYLLAPSRASLLVEVAQRERDVVPDLYQLEQAVSVYIGIPFCPTHCAYCTFPAYSMIEKARYAQSFLDVLLMEVRRTGALLREYGVPITTVYVGGGTPTSLKAPELRLLLEALRTELPGADHWREFSVEAGRADTITADRVQVMKDCAVTRVSVNPQSFRAATLKAMGRGHSPEIVDKRFALFREAGFTNINMDVILGLPGETLDDVRYTMERTLRLQPDAVTVHTLSFKHSSEVSRDRDAYSVAPPSEVRAMMELADRAARDAGQLPYYLYRQKDILANLENVGYSLAGKEGIYNIAIIEEAQTIIALGGGGASKWVAPGKGIVGRHQNPREPSVYVGTLETVWARKEAALRPVLAAIAAQANRHGGDVVDSDTAYLL